MDVTTMILLLILLHEKQIIRNIGILKTSIYFF